MITFTWEQTPYKLLLLAGPAKEIVGEVRVVDTVSRFCSLLCGSFAFANQIGAGRPTFRARGAK